MTSALRHLLGLLVVLGTVLQAAAQPAPPLRGGRPGGPVLSLPAPGDVPAYEPPPEGVEPEPAELDTRPRFLGGEPDDDVLDRLCNAPIRSIVPLGGGASISLKAVLEGGYLAAIKPEQVRVTRYRSEVAAYYVSRALHLDKVAPSCVRRLPRELLFNSKMPISWQKRMEKEMRVDVQGQVACAVIQWIPHLRGLGLEKQPWWRPLLLRGISLPREKRRRVLDIATLLLLDYLVVNDDRWSGGNTHESDGRMVYLDQGAGFGSDRSKRGYLFAKLRWSQRFDKAVAEALFELDVNELRGSLRPYLSDRELQELAERVEEARGYLRKLQKEAPGDSLL